MYSEVQRLKSKETEDSVSITLISTWEKKEQT